MFFVLLNYGKLLRDELYVMLMLQRSEALAGGSSSSTSDCDDPMVKVACSMDTDACPAACKTESKDDEPTVVKAGDLVVSAEATPGKKALINGAVSDLDMLTFKSSEEVEITKVTLEKYGYSDGSVVVSGVWLEDADGNTIAAERSLNSKDQLTLSIKKDYRSVDGVMNATIVLRTNAGTGYAGGTIGFKVIDVESSAENLNIDNYRPNEYELANYQWSVVTLANKGANGKNYNYEAGNSYEIARFKVTTNNAAILMNGFTLKNPTSYANAVDMDKFLSDVEVTLDGKAIKAKYSVNRDQELTISFDEIELAAKKNAIFVVSVSFSEDFDDYSKSTSYGIADGDFNAVEKKTGARVKLAGAMLWAQHTFEGGKIRLSNTKLGNRDAAAGASDVVFAEGSITVSEPISKVTFVVTWEFSTGSYTGLANMKFVVAGEEYDANSITANGTTGFVAHFNNVDIEKSGKVQFKLDLDNEAKWTVSFSTTFGRASLSGAQYDSARKPVLSGDVAGSITLYNVNVQAAKAAVENNLTKKVEFLIGETSRKVVFDGTYTARKGDVNLNKFWFESGAALPGTNEIEFYVFVDGEEVGNTNVFDSEETFSDVLVKDGKSVAIRVEAEVVADDTTGRTYTGISLHLKGSDDDTNDAGIGSDDLVEFETKESGSVTIPAAKLKSTALLRSANSVVAEFTVKPSNSNEGIMFDNIVLTGTQFNSGDFKVKIDGVEYFDPEAAGTSGWKYTVNEELPVEWVVVQVTAKKALTGKVTVDVVSVNGKLMGNTYSRFFAESLVSFTKQDEGTSSTTYTVAVDHYDDAYSVSGFKLYAVSGSTCDKTTAIKTVGLVNDGDTFTVYRTDKAQEICQVSYEVWDTTKIQTVDIDKDTYQDYFKVDWKELAVPKA